MRKHYPSDYRPTQKEHTTVHVREVVQKECEALQITYRVLSSGEELTIGLLAFSLRPVENRLVKLRRDLVNYEAQWRLKEQGFEPGQVQEIKREWISVDVQPCFKSFVETVSEDGRRKVPREPGRLDPGLIAQLDPFIKAKAAKEAGGDPKLLDDLVQEAWLRLSGLSTDELHALRTEAKRAIWAAAKAHREHKRREKPDENLTP